MNKVKLITCIVISLVGIPSVLAAVYFDDSWVSSDSSTSDGVVWGGYLLNTYASGYNSQADCLCWDWCDNGGTDENYSAWDTCWCKSTAAKTACKSYSSWMTNWDSEGKVSIDSDLGAFHSINTGSSGDRWTCGIDLREYRDCDNSSGMIGIYNYEGQAGTPYYVVYPKKYSCNGEAYDTEGWFNSNTVVIWKQGTSCSPYSRCDTNSVHNHHDNQQITSATQTIPNPCSLKDGSNSNYQCSGNNDCYSGNCGESINNDYRYLCDSDGTDLFYDEHLAVYNTCGGSGYSGDWIFNPEGPQMHYCTTTYGAGYVCDSHHDKSPVTYPSNPPSPCKKNIGQSCSATTDCWNDDGGNWCNSISKCTDGANGRTCGSNSDCTSNHCCGSICSSTSCYNETDLAILDIIPIQVVSDVPLIKGKSGYVRVLVHNYGPANATAQVNVTFDGTPLVPLNATKFIINGSNETFNFHFKPDVVGNNKVIIANVTIMS